MLYYKADVERQTVTPMVQFFLSSTTCKLESFHLVYGKISVFSAGYSVHNFHISPTRAKTTFSIVLCYSTLHPEKI
jgi:hypothetical protein